MRIHEFQFPLLFEVNFNDPKLKNILDEEIACGFEAETIWTEVDRDSFDPEYDELSWSDDIVQYNISARDHNTVEREYRDWILEHSDYNVAVMELQNDWANENYSDYYADFVDARGLDDEWTEWSEENEGSVGDFIEENYEDDYKEYLIELSYEEDVSDEAYERVSDDYSINDWAESEYGSVYRMLQEFTSWEPPGDEGLDSIGDLIETWASDNSLYTRVKTGEYHSYSSVGQSFWRVEKDSSIDESEGVGAEIISPVYNTPREMIEEMNGLFRYLMKNGVKTDESVGLHVTMSWTKESNVVANKLKMVLLLGDQYLLKQFNREYNTYTPSQYNKVKRAVEELSSDVTSDKISELENMLSKSISSDKYSSIHFKNVTNDDGNKLIEFRIMGDEDYEKNIEKIEKTIIRYAVAMKAGYEDSFHKDYVKALIRLFTKKSKLDPELSKDPELDDTPIKDNKLYQNIKNIVSNTRYKEAMSALHKAILLINKANEIRDESGQSELFENPNQESDEDSAWQSIYQEHLRYAKIHFLRFLKLLILDVAERKTRDRINAQTIYQLRQTIPQFQLTYEDIWQALQRDDSIIAVMGTGSKRDKLLKAILDKLFGKSESIQINEPLFTLDYNPEQYRMFIPETLWDAINDLQGVNIKKEDFILIPQDEYGNIRNKRGLKEAYEIELEQIKEQLAYQQKSIDEKWYDSDDQNNNVLNYIKTLEDKIKFLESNIEPYTVKIQEFLRKYGFVPRSTRPDSDSIGTSMMPVNHQIQEKLAEYYNIEIDIK